MRADPPPAHPGTLRVHAGQRPRGPRRTGWAGRQSRHRCRPDGSACRKRGARADPTTPRRPAPPGNEWSGPMTGHQPGADAGDELCPWLTDTGPAFTTPGPQAAFTTPSPQAAFTTPSPQVGASDELCPHLTEPDEAVPNTQPPVVRVPRAVGVAY